MMTFEPSAAGGSVYQPPNRSSSNPGEIQSAGLLNNTSFTRAWSGTGYCIVMPIGCRMYPRSRSYALTESITQYCQAVESPIRPGIDEPSGNGVASASRPDDSLATSYSTFGRSW